MGAIITVICNFIHKICSNQNSVLLKKKNIINFEEEQYLGIIKKLLKEEKLGSGRDGTKTLSTFGVQMRFSLENGSFPLLTTKKMFFRGIFEELLWIIRGCTDSKDLENKNVNIWKKNGSRENLDKLNFINREEGDLGPIYGFQWRHFGDHYTTCKDKYVGGIDQLHNCINLIKTDPSSRRIIISAWNPLDIEKMVLPPCHVLYQFHVKNGELSCSLYQRSGDMGIY
jgi:thymidylate synthase